MFILNSFSVVGLNFRLRVKRQEMMNLRDNSLSKFIVFLFSATSPFSTDLIFIWVMHIIEGSVSIAELFFFILGTPICRPLEYRWWNEFLIYYVWQMFVRIHYHTLVKQAQTPVRHIPLTHLVENRHPPSMHLATERHSPCISGVWSVGGTCLMAVWFYLTNLRWEYLTGTL